MGHGKEELWNNGIKGKHCQYQRTKTEDSIRKGERLTGKRGRDTCMHANMYGFISV